NSVLCTTVQVKIVVFFSVAIGSPVRVLILQTEALLPQVFTDSSGGICPSGVHSPKCRPAIDGVALIPLSNNHLGPTPVGMGEKCHGLCTFVGLHPPLLGFTPRCLTLGSP